MYGTRGGGGRYEMWMQDNRYADMVLQRLLVTPRDDMAWVGTPKTATAATTTRPKRDGKAKRRNKGKQNRKGAADKGGAAEGEQDDSESSSKQEL